MKYSELWCKYGWFLFRHVTYMQIQCTLLKIELQILLTANTVFIKLLGPPIVEKLPQQLHAVFGERFKIICNATNDPDAPMNLKFSWSGPNGVQFITMNDIEDNSLSATSTLLISNVTDNHGGVYQCTVSNGKHERAKTSITSTLVVEGKNFLSIVCT